MRKELTLMTYPIQIHPQNPKIFEFRGKPRILLCATEHYGAVMNRPFRFERYLADAHEKSQTLTRLFMLFRELQTSHNPYSTGKPESPDYVAPFKRTGPGMALDGQPKYDLDQWNPEFFDRLHRFLSLASDYGIIVEVVFLSNTYSSVVWSLNPLNSKNNLNDVEESEWQDYMTMRHPKLFRRQCVHVRKIVEETNKYDNIIYEICNEPGGKLPGDNKPTLEEVNDWQMAIARLVRETEADLPNKHLIAGQEAFTYHPWEQSSAKSFKDLGIDIVNIHPLPNTTYGGISYDMGEFMSKQLKLRALRDYCSATRYEPKPLNLDEDNIASQYKDYDGWTIHRKRAWTTLFCGCHYDYIDFSIINYCETGTVESQRYIRTWMKHLSEFIHSIDLVRAKPLVDWLKEKPDKTVESVLAVEGEDYCIYLADARKLTDPGAGDTIQGDIAFDLPEGSYKMACFSPVTGLYSPWMPVQPGKAIRISVPAFQHDIVIRIARCVERET
ncbi:hypothetical protein FJZ31_00295 [Candidatus Poribacteria bacterium]|nr:hypothetical protein [Candidatus Poribacteria bacterium]